ncbi:hypothetical protein LPB140_08090 [Sphingorhabdus lutea]|uniref:PilZ domain-containing protein n=1 Tax=Sphingorhabdus lutea TaxID=1913578 RepID=A0A1L3JEY6_9SPHN|nr:PilZ domain-containing protein [Sphingorhabdus lutea]APG63708.1 hypothetical protein LPB140_08090 [Sphingorhabdus lutea]
MKSSADMAMDLRRAARHRTDINVNSATRKGEEHLLHIVNISAHGFMIDNHSVLNRGDRVTLRLPIIGEIEAYMIWSIEERAGFQLERVIRLPDFIALLDEIGSMRR